MLKLRPSRRNTRGKIGGRWDEIGSLQFEYLVQQGLTPTDDLLDIGCGSLRGGIQFARYLDPGTYCGIDIDEAQLIAGRKELKKAGVTRPVELIHDGLFSFDRFGRKFRWALAQSVFTHLPFNTIARCVANVEHVLEPGGKLYATYFPGCRLDIEPHQLTDGFVAHPDRDPYYHDPDIFRWLTEGSTLKCENVGDWNHPRGQHMLTFTKH